MEIAGLESVLRERIRGYGSALIALSGGVDSAVIAALAAQELGANALAVTGVSASLAQHEASDAAAVCRQFALRHRLVETDELNNPAYRRNDPNRCYHCKDTLYERLRTVAEAERMAVVLDGTHADDVGRHRPGYEAAKTHGVRSPLLDAGADKAAVRDLARRLGLPSANKPATPCLSSRIAYGVTVTPERLQRVEKAETYLRSLGLGNLRVRLHDSIARIEVPEIAMSRVVDHGEEIHTTLRSLGFVYVTLDLGGLRSGSLLEVFQESA